MRWSLLKLANDKTHDHLSPFSLTRQRESLFLDSLPDTSAAEFRFYNLIDHLPVNVLAREFGHDGLHDRADLLDRDGAGLGDGLLDDARDGRFIHGGGQIFFDDLDLGGFLVGQLHPPGLLVLFDAVTAL